MDSFQSRRITKGTFAVDKGLVTAGVSLDASMEELVTGERTINPVIHDSPFIQCGDVDKGAGANKAGKGLGKVKLSTRQTLPYCIGGIDAVVVVVLMGILRANPCQGLAVQVFFGEDAG